MYRRLPALQRYINESSPSYQKVLDLPLDGESQELLSVLTEVNVGLCQLCVGMIGTSLLG